MSIDSDVFQKGVDLDTSDRANRAIKAFRALQPTLTAYARILTKDPTIQVVMAAKDNGSTDGKKIYFRPPITLGDNLGHERRFCDKRDADKQLICPACAIREEVLVTIYHEIAHNCFDSFEETSEAHKAEMVAHAIREAGGKYAEQIAAQIKTLPSYMTSSYVAMAGIISPFLPIIVNALEDARVNRELFTARKGTKVMFDADMWRIFTKGVEQIDPQTGELMLKQWDTYPLNMQAIVGIFTKASGYDYADWFTSEIVTALDDPELTRLINQMATVRSVSAVYQLSFPVLARLRELGYCKSAVDPIDPDDPENPDGLSGPEKEEEKSDDKAGDETDDNQSDEMGSSQSDDPAGTPEDAPSRTEDCDDDKGEPSDSGTEDGGSDDSDEGGSSESSGTGANEDSSTDSEEDSGSGDNADGSSDSGDSSTEESGENSSDSDDEQERTSSDDPDSNDGAGDGSSDQDGDASGTASEGEHVGSGSDDGTAVPEESDQENEESHEGRGDISADSSGSSEGDPSSGQSTSPDKGNGANPDDSNSDDTGGQRGSGDESGDDSLDQDDNSGESSDKDSNDLQDEEGTGSSGLDLAGSEDGTRESSCDESDMGTVQASPEGSESGDLSSSDTDTDTASESTDTDSSSKVSTEETDELIDTGADDGTGGVQLIEKKENDRLPMGTPEECERGLLIVGNHEEKPKTIEEGIAENAVDRALIQGVYFETPSQYIYGVREHHFGQPQMISGYNMSRGWEDIYSSGLSTGRLGDFSTPEKILGPALVRMRVAFSDNQRGKESRGRRSGKVDARVLGKRAPANDPRLFKKKTLPGKKDYYVLIGMDVSASTIGRNLKLEKQAVTAQAALLSRMGIPFEIYAYSGNLHNPRAGRYEGIDLDIYLIKEGNEPWDRKTRERLDKIGPDAANLDGHTLEYLRKKLDHVTATDKIIMYYSDGQFPAENHDEELIILRRELKICKQKGYLVLGVGIRTDSPIRHGMDTVQVDSEEDVIKVIRHLEKRLLA